MKGTLRSLMAGTGTRAIASRTVVASILTLLLNLLTGVLTARVLGAQGRGVQAAIILWPQFLAYCVTIGLPSALVYWIRSDAERAKEFVWAAVSIAAPAGTVAGGVGALFLPMWLGGFSDEVVRVAQLFMLAAPFLLITLVTRASFQADQNFRVYNRLWIAPPLGTLLLLLLLWETDHFTPVTTAIAYVGPEVGAGLWSMWALRGWGRLRSSYRRTVGELTHFGSRAWVADVVTQLSQRMDLVAVAGYLEPRDVGLYVVAIALARPIYVIPSSIAAVLLPRLMRESPERAAELSGMAVRAAVIAMALVGGALMLAASVALSLLYGEEFRGAVQAFRILAFDSIIGGMVWLLLQPFLALKRPGAVSGLQSIGVGLNIALLSILTPRYGINGAAASIVIASSCRLVLSLLAYRYVLGTPIPNVVPWRRDVVQFVNMFRRHTNS